MMSKPFVSYFYFQWYITYLQLFLSHNKEELLAFCITQVECLLDMMKAILKLTWKLSVYLLPLRQQ